MVLVGDMFDGLHRFLKIVMVHEKMGYSTKKELGNFMKLSTSL